MLLVLGLLVVVGIVVAAVVFGRKSEDESYITFPCRSCNTPQKVSVAETMRRLREAHGKGALAELSKHEILCPKCGASQTADWLMAPRTKKLLNDLDATVYRDQTTAEYMNIVAADSPGALNTPALQATPSAAAPISANGAPPPLPSAAPVQTAPSKPGEPQRS